MADSGADEMRRRLVKKSDMVACKLAFIDCKMPGSEGKLNYSLIGAGVTQSADQVVNITEPHGFSMGVAAMAPGTTNNLHIHYTAEVFMVFKGQWTFRWGADGDDGAIVGEPGDVLSMPTWIFRGFSNTGAEDGWIFTSLGGDDTGGIIWHPSILRTAAGHGLFLTRDNMMVDTAAGAPRPAPEDLLEPMGEDAIRALRRYSEADMRKRVVTRAERQWSRAALLDAVLPGHASAMAPAVGFGMTQDRDHEPKVASPHGHSIEWLRVEAGNAVGPFRLDEPQAVVVFEGAADITLGTGDDAVTMRAEAQEVFSFPPGAWRTIRAAGDAPAELTVLTAGDHRKRIEWDRAIVAEAARHGIAVDHNGCVAPLRLLPREVQMAVAA